MDHKEGWVLKNCYFRILVLEKTPESLGLQGDQIKQPWVFIGKTDTEAEAPVLWPPDVKSWLIWKDSDAAKDWGQEKKRVTEDEMVGWHYWLNGHELEQTLGHSKGQRSLVCCSLWGSQRVRHNLVTGQQQINVKRGLKDRALIQYD